MATIKDQIIIQDWTGKILFEGRYDSHGVDETLDVNRCLDCPDNEYCHKCNDTGYWGDFEIYWVDTARKDNVYEYINY